MPRSGLLPRLLTAAVGLPLVLAVTWVGGAAFALVAGAIALLAAAEFVHGWLFPSQRIVAVLPQAPALAGVAWIVAGVHWDVQFIWLGVALGALVAAAGYSRTNRLGPRKPLRVLGWCIGYVGLLFSTFVLTRDLAGGRDWMFLALLSTFAVDTGAYTAGRLTGRHLLAPAISPKKTIEGAVGGLAAGVAAVFALNAALDTGVSAWTIAPLALLLPVAAEAGDLFESWLKRRMGVKDASGLLPGHGGFLDRLDSVLFVMPVVYVFLKVRVV